MVVSLLLFMLKKLMSWGLAAYLAFSPIVTSTVEANSFVKNYKIEHKVDIDKTRYVKSLYKGATIHSFMADMNKYNIKVCSAVCPYLSDYKKGDSKTLSFDSKGSILEKIVSEHESKSGKNVMGALNGSYFDIKTYHIVGREMVNDRVIKRKVKKKKDISKKLFVRKKFPDYDFKFRASFYVNQKGLPEIGYYDDISKAKYFLTAGSMLVQGGKNVWKEAYEKEMFDKAHLKPYKRGVVAITKKGNVMFLATTEITLDDLTDFLIKIKVKDAMCVDSGSSVQLMLDKSFNKDKYKDYLIYGTKRKIVNGIAVVEK